VLAENGQNEIWPQCGGETLVASDVEMMTLVDHYLMDNYAIRKIEWDTATEEILLEINNIWEIKKPFTTYKIHKSKIDFESQFLDNPANLIGRRVAILESRFQFLKDLIGKPRNAKRIKLEDFGGGFIWKRM
jgi:hypothetical protein